MTDSAASSQTLEHLEDAVTHISAAILLLNTDDGSRLGEAKAIIRSVMFDLDNQMVERSGLIEMEE